MIARRLLQALWRKIFRRDRYRPEQRYMGGKMRENRMGVSQAGCVRQTDRSAG